MPRTPGNRYPATAAECLDDSIRYRRGVVAAVRRFKREHPWKGALEERREKFRRCLRELARVYGMPVPVLRLAEITGGSSGASSCLRPLPGSGRAAEITMRGRLSVLTFLHEFAHALGKGERGACRWSLNLFARVFPRNFARCTSAGHVLVRRDREGSV